MGGCEIEQKRKKRARIHGHGKKKEAKVNRVALCSFCVAAKQITTNLTT